MIGTGKIPTAEDILSLLVKLYADQMGVEIKFEIEHEERSDGHDQTAVCGM